MKRNRLKVDTPIAILALLLSLAIFIISLPERMSKSYKPMRIQLTYRNLDEKHFYVAKQQASVTVTANVSDDEYKDLSVSARAEADLTVAEPGSKAYPVSIYPKALLNLLKDSNTQAVFVLEARKTRDVPVLVETSGKLIDPTEIVDQKRPEPLKASVDGPASEVAKVIRARATLRLDMLDNHSQQQQVTIEPVDKDDHVVDKVEIHPNQAIVTFKYSLAPQQKQAFVEAQFGDGKVPAGYEVKSYSVEPTFVTLSGSSEALSHIAKVSTERIDISKMTSSQTVIVPLKPVAKDVTMKPPVVQVKIVIQPVAVKSLSPSTSAPPVGSGGKTGGSTAGG